MNKYHLIPLAFLVLAIIRIIIMGRSRRLWCLLFVWCVGQTWCQASTVQLSIVNAGSTAGPNATCGQFKFYEKQYDHNGNIIYNRYDGGYWPNVPAGGYLPYAYTNCYGTLNDGAGSYTELTITFPGTNVAYAERINWPTVNYGTAVLIFNNNGCTVSNPPPPCRTNLTFNVKNDNPVPNFYYQALARDGIFMGGLWLNAGMSGQSFGNWACSNAPNVRLYQIPSTWNGWEGTGYVLNNAGGTMDAWGDPVSNGSLEGFYNWNGEANSGAGAPFELIPESSLPAEVVNPVGSSGSGPAAGQPGGPSAGAPTPLTSRPPSQYDPTSPNQSGTNSPILWTAGSATNAAQASQQGFGALWDVNSQLGQQAHNDALAIEAGQNGIYTNAVAVGLANAQWSSNLLASMNAGLASDAAFRSNVLAHGLSITNLGGMITNQTLNTSNLATEATLRITTNYLASSVGLLGSVTNLLGEAGKTNGMEERAFGIGTNMLGRAMGFLSSFIPSTATNGAAAAAAAGAAETNYGQSSFATWEGQAIEDAHGSGAPGGMSFTFCGTEFNLDPVVRFPGLCSVSYNGFKIVAQLAFLLVVGRMFWELVRAKSAAQTGGVPDLMVEAAGSVFGIGGSLGANILGVLVAIVIPALFIGAFYYVLYWVVSAISFSVVDAMNLSSWENSLGAIGIYLLTSFLPVNTIWTLACLTVSMHFTLGQFYNIACNIVRYLWGK